MYNSTRTLRVTQWCRRYGRPVVAPGVVQSPHSMKHASRSRSVTAPEQSTGAPDAGGAGPTPSREKQTGLAAAFAPESIMAA